MVVLIEDYFARVDFSQMRPGAPVAVAGEPIDPSLTLHSGQAK